ncbi:ABC transporter substrate-binding protein [Sphingomonas naphthae]|uniref:ABC transporter substrate-binding protein n=1 Tax=Sphingomonas naphthae TaxID=1813468 RepID=A0ABY7TP83_9SPHN|nr:ABC transporter substrate-binding protein [Sphingomonas naphthae]WCT74796.1 ABC transporter substrate-binding protein [Sphingomonas naphthae]
MRRLLPLALLTLAGCGERAPEGPIDVSVIGNVGELPSPVRAPIDAATGLILGSIAQGLVRLDATGQIEAGLAARWDVSDDGLYYTFRIADGAPIDAEEAARLLRRAIDRRSDNLLKPVLGAIEEIVAVTPEVIEIRLSAPRADMLQLLAAPEMALARRGEGGGPFRLEKRDGPRFRLLLPQTPATPDADAEPPPPKVVTVHAEWASKAVARYVAGLGSLVTGGTFADLPLVAAAEVDARQLRYDPVHGLFGLRVMRGSGWLGDPANRLRLSRAIDRARIARLIGVPNLAPVAIAGGPPTAGAAPAPEEPLRIALPPGAGARLLFRQLQADWRRIGVAAEMTTLDDSTADIRLIDEVAPTEAEDWPIARFACASSGAAPCSADADSALDTARTAPSPEARAQAIADARAALDASGLFMGLTQPVRWSLVNPALTGWQENARGAHPLDQVGR